MRETVNVTYRGLEVGSEAFVIDWAESKVLQVTIVNVSIGFRKAGKGLEANFYDYAFSSKQLSDPGSKEVETIVRSEAPDDVFNSEEDALRVLLQHKKKHIKDIDKDKAHLTNQIKELQKRLNYLKEHPHAKI